MKKKWFFSVFAIVALLTISCTTTLNSIVDKFYKTPEIDAFSKAVKVSLPLAYAANIAMNAVNKRADPGVTIVRTPADSFPCTAIIQIPVNASHPLPVGSQTVAGSMMVAGLFSDSASAVVSVFFTNTNIKDGSFTVKDVAFVPVVRDTGGTMVVFASEDVNADSAATFSATLALTDSAVKIMLDSIPLTLPTDSSVAVNQKAYITLVKRPAGAGLGGEVYTLYGASQYLGVNASTTEVVQAVMLAVSMTPSVCRLNPTSGYAMIRDLKVQDSNSNSTVEMGTTVLTFDAACDGTASIPLATGCYLGRIGSSAALNLEN